jgi:nitroreductase
MESMESFAVTANTLDDFEALVTKRRTNLFMDNTRAVDEELVVRLCELITWAPNHKRTWPWAVAIVRNEGRARLGEASARDLAALGVTDDAKLTKTRNKYLRSPVVVAVAQQPQTDPHRAGEDRDAVAAGIQNFLLGATSAGLASYWGSASNPTGSNTLDVCGFATGSRISALIYLGWPADNVVTPERPPFAIGLVE